MAKSYAEVCADARSAVTITHPDELKARLDAGESVMLIDVREPDEWRGGTLPGAHPVPRGVLEGAVDHQVPRSATLVLYCEGGNRSALAARSLKEMGYDKVESLEGGYRGWTMKGFPTESP